MTKNVGRIKFGKLKNPPPKNHEKFRFRPPQIQFYRTEIGTRDNSRC